MFFRLRCWAYLWYTRDHGSVWIHQNTWRDYVKGLAQGPNRCTDLIVAAPGIEPPTLCRLSALIWGYLHPFFRCCLANSNLAHQWFTSCGEPSVFTLVKSSLDCWLWHTYTYLLESVLDLANCCEGVFLHQGNNSSVIHHSCFPWSSGSFGVAELTGAFFLFKNVPNSWFGHA